MNQRDQKHKRQNWGVLMCPNEVPPPEDTETLSHEIGKQRESDILLLNTPISQRSFGAVVSEVSRTRINNRHNIDVILVTFGGDAN